MIIFSDVTCRADTTDFVSRGLVSGSPICYAGLIDWTIFQDFLKECKPESKVTVEVKTYGYGEDDGYGKFDATPEEVAYMTLRSRDNERFCETRCEKLRQHKIDIDLSAFRKADRILSHVIYNY